MQLYRHTAKRYVDDIPNFGYDSPKDITTLKRQCEHLLSEFSVRKGKGLSLSERNVLEGINATLNRLDKEAIK